MLGEQEAGQKVRYLNRIGLSPPFWTAVPRLTALVGKSPMLKIWCKTVQVR